MIENPACLSAACQVVKANTRLRVVGTSRISLQSVLSILFILVVDSSLVVHKIQRTMGLMKTPSVYADVELRALPDTALTPRASVDTASRVIAFSTLSGMLCAVVTQIWRHNHFNAAVPQVSHEPVACTALPRRLEREVPEGLRHGPFPTRSTIG